MERKSFIINIDRKLAEEVDEMALGNNLTGNEMVEALLRYGVQNAKSIGRIVKNERDLIAAQTRALEASRKPSATKPTGPMTSLRPLTIPDTAPRAIATTGPRSTTEPRPVSANKLHPGVPTFKIPQMPKTNPAAPVKTAPDKAKPANNTALKNGK